jgi:hypothetical protein
MAVDAPASATRPSPRSRGGSSSQTATRLLVILDVLGNPVAPGSRVPHAVKVVSSLTRLEKLDFWVRNPDYLADELLNEVDAGRRSVPEVAAQVSRMLGGTAPSLHRYPMARYLFGAYERVDNSLAILKAYGHITTHRVSDHGDTARRDYFLLTKGETALARMRTDVPALGWYDEQASAITLIADAATGASARKRQYQQSEYESTPIGSTIPDITERVIARAEEFGIAITH